MIIMKLVKLTLLAITCQTVCCLAWQSSGQELEGPAPLQLQPPVDQLAEPELESFGLVGEQKKLENAAAQPSEVTQTDPPPTVPAELHPQPPAPEIVPPAPSTSNQEQLAPVVGEVPLVPASIIAAPQQQQQQQQPEAAPQDVAPLANITITPASTPDAPPPPPGATPNQASHSVVTQDPALGPVAQAVAVLDEVEQPAPGGPINSPPPKSLDGIQPQIIQADPDIVAPSTETDTSHSLNRTPQTIGAGTTPAPEPLDVEPANQESTPAPEQIAAVGPSEANSTKIPQPVHLEPARVEVAVAERVPPNGVPEDTEADTVVAASAAQDVSQDQEVAMRKSSSDARISTNSIQNATLDLGKLPLPAGLELASLAPVEAGAVDDDTMGYEELGSEDVAPFWFTLDKGNCDSIIPEAILNQTVAKLFSIFFASNCTDKIGFKLGPFENRRIRGHVMETSASVLSISQLLRPKLPIRVQCLNISSAAAANQIINFGLNVGISSQDAWLENRWRKYPQSKNLDEIPLELPGEIGKLKSLLAASSSSSSSASTSSSSSSSSSSGSAGLLGASGSKCQRFKVQGGTHKFALSDFGAQFSFVASLKRLEQRAYQLTRLRVLHFRLQRLHLGPSALLIDGGAGAGEPANLSATAPATVQILHDQNNHHRRNNWLLDLYANWLRHEYRAQLGEQLSQQSAAGLVSRLNGSCKLTSRPPKSPERRRQLAARLPTSGSGKPASWRLWVA